MGNDQQHSQSPQPAPESDVGSETVSLSSAPWDAVRDELGAIPFASGAAPAAAAASNAGAGHQAGLPFDSHVPVVSVAKPMPGMASTMDTDMTPAMVALIAQHRSVPHKASPYPEQVAPQPPSPPKPIAAPKPPVVSPARPATALAAGSASPWAKHAPQAPAPIGRGPDPLSDMPAPAPAAQQAQPARREAPSTSVGEEELLQLLWYEPEAVPRMRRHESWSQLLEELEDEPPDLDLDDTALDGDAMDVEDHRDTFEILSRAKPHTSARLKEVLAKGIHRGRKLVPPLALFAGTLIFVFDHVEELKATVTTATPFTSAAEALGPAIEDANAFLAMPHLLSAPDVARALTKRIADTFRRLDRIVSPTHLEEQTRRALLENRHYKRCELLGQEHIAALWQPPDNSRERIPTYLPASLSSTLPMYAHFRARFIAAVEPSASEFDEHPIALRAVALSRLAPTPY